MPERQQPTAGADSGQVLRSVSECLRRVIRAGVPELQGEDAVVFDSPADIDAQGANKLSLYLYHMAVNPYLRNLPPTPTRRAGGAGPASLRLVPAPLVVDLTYVMVPYGKSAELELVLADKLSRLFHRVGALAGPLLDPVLSEAGNATIAIVPEPSTPENMRNLWSGFGNKPYRLTQMYTVSPVRLPAEADYAAAMTTQSGLNAGEVRH